MPTKNKNWFTHVTPGEEWKREKCAELAALIYIEENILDSYRKELSELRQLSGKALLVRFGWESPAEVARVMKAKDTWIAELEEIWVEGKYRENQ